MLLSVVIPAYNEALSITETLEKLYAKLRQEQIAHELVVVNDNSKDNTLEVLEALKKTVTTLVVLKQFAFFCSGRRLENFLANNFECLVITFRTLKCMKVT